MPPHSLYIEPFLGAGAVLRHKLPAASTIALDADADVLAAFRAVGVPDGCTVICADALEWLESWALIGVIASDALVYCDPPYVRSTRRSDRDLYRFELTDDDHRRLLRCLRSLPCCVMVSGYWSELYAEELAGWHTHSFQTMTRGNRPATEWLWMNYPEPFELHDYRYLGVNYRERERIKRKKQRWLAHLSAMPALERYAILDVLSELRAGSVRDRRG
jgi:hypothetical protein